MLDDPSYLFLPHPIDPSAFTLFLAEKGYSAKLCAVACMLRASISHDPFLRIKG